MSRHTTPTTTGGIIGSSRSARVKRSAIRVNEQQRQCQPIVFTAKATAA
jgi:hypothetical protein